MCTTQCGQSIYEFVIDLINFTQIDKKNGKVEKILKGSLDLIPSPSSSVKVQIMEKKVCLRCKGKTLLGDVNKLFVFNFFQ